MTNYELMIPRYRVIADYPSNLYFKIGDVLEKLSHVQDGVGRFIDKTTGCAWIVNPEKYPAIVRKMEWWEGRLHSEYPEYFRHIPTGRVIRAIIESQITHALIELPEGVKKDMAFAKGIVVKYCSWVNSKGGIENFEPSTKDEYQTQRLLNI